MLLAVFRVSTARAAGVTLLLTVLSALVVYKADVQLVLFESLKGVWSTATILYIIFPALLLYELIAASGAIDVMNDTMRQLSRWSVEFAFPETRTAYGIVNAATAKYSPFHPLVDSGTVLLLTCIISYALLRGRGLLERSQLRTMLSRTLQKTRPVAVSLILLLIISKLMSGSGQTLVLAQGITHVMGRWYALLAGVLGVIGSFVTGSNMSSNILFTDVQVNVAADLGVSSSPPAGGADRRRLRW